MDKNKLFKLNIVILFAVFFMNHETYGQSSCSTANNITISTPVVISTQTAIASEHWVSFIASNDSAYLQCFDDNYGIQQIDIYDGSCGNPILIATSSNDYIVLTGLTVNSSYLVKFTSTNTNGNFKLVLALSFPTLHIERNGSLITPGAWNNICIGDQLEVWATWGANSNHPTNYSFLFGGNGINDWFSVPMATNINSSQHTIFTVNSSTTLGQWPVFVGVSFDGGNTYIFNYSDVGWPNVRQLDIQTTPNITFTPSPNPACPLEYVYHNIPTLPYFGDWGDGNPINSAFGTINHQYQQTGNYIITASSTNVCGTESHQETVVVAIAADFEFTNQCVGNTVQFTDLTTCSTVLGEWQWDFGDGMGFVYTSSSNPTHTYTNPGTYTVKLKVKTKYHQIYLFYNGNEEEFSVSKQVTIYPKPEPAIISGINNSCDGVDDIQYDIDNYQNTSTYNWTITQGSGTFNNTTNTTATGQTNTVDWSSIPSLPAHAQIQIQTTDNNGCQSIATKNIFECCDLDRPDVILNNETITGNPTTYSGKRIMINGTLTIDADVLFEDDGAGTKTDVFMGPEAKIVVTSGHSVEFNNSIVQSNCEYMWDGIWASGNTSSIEFDNSELKEAINGIVADNAAVVKLKNSDFIDNYKSVQINNYVPNIINPVNYSGEIYGCNFYTRNAVINNGSWITPATDADYYLNLAPMTGKQSFAAIMVKKVGLINIGDASKNQNFFAKQQYGVYAETSEPTIRNNEFQYIKKKYSNGQSGFLTKLPESAAIFGVYYYKKFLNLSIDRTMIVGDISLTGSNYSNIFENCEVGIMTKNYRNKIYKNKFLQTSNSAVYLYDMASGGDIQYNYMSNNTSLPNTRGIYGANTTQRKITLNIENNMIYYMKWGVALTNAASFSFPSNPLLVQVHNNAIALNPIDNAKRYAIKVAACDRIEIRENTITRIGNSSSADATKVVGISLRQTQSAKVTDNYMYKMGSGIMTNGAMYNTQFFCNTMSLNYHGFYFGDKTGLTNFGWKNVPNLSDFNPQNKWVNNINEKMYNHNIINQQPVNYYYYDQNVTSIPYSANNDPEIGSGSSCYSYIIPSPSNSATFYCSNSNGPNLLINDDEITTDAERDELLSEFLEGEEYSALSEEFRSYEIEYLYELLDNDTSIMWLGGGDDGEYQEFYNEVKNSVNAKFIDVDNYIAEGDFENAYASNTAIYPANSFEANRQQSNKIYLETYLNDDYMLAVSTINSLTSIASQTPYAGGYGVYTARVMLDYDPDQNGVTWRLAPSVTNPEQETIIRVFPNPAKEILFVEVMSKTDNYKANMQVYNSMGQLVAEQQLSQKLEYISLDKLKTGMYFYTIQYNNGYTENGKFLIQQ